MMKNIARYLLLILCLGLWSCHSDDDGGTTIQTRDEGEVYQENLQQIKSFLKTHFYKLAPNPYHPEFTRVVFDTIAGANADKTPLMDLENLKTLTYKPGNIQYTVYYLVIRKGSEGAYEPTFADKVVMTYQAYTLEGETFDSALQPEVFDIPQTQSQVPTKGVVLGISHFRGASGFQINPDGTLSYNDDFGIGAVFVPSGLAYFNNPPAGGLDPYEPYAFCFQLYNGIQMDHDGDGIPSYMEDIDGNGFLGDDDTDQNGVPNFLDPDDDGDGIPTAEEIIVHMPADSIITPDDIEFPDSNGDGVPDYLDPTYPP